MDETIFVIARKPDKGTANKDTQKTPFVLMRFDEDHHKYELIFYCLHEKMRKEQSIPLTCRF